MSDGYLAGLGTLMKEAVPKFGPEQVAHFAKLTSAYIRSQREHFYENGEIIDEAHQQTLQAFFPTRLLREVRVARNVQVPDPPFYGDLKKTGLSNLPEFSRMAAVTFMDVIAFQGPVNSSTLFHELVHVLQYQYLGVEDFAERYVRGFLCSGSYEGIPLEINAYGLQARFDANGLQPFSVEAEVERWAREQRF
jgi:hypothetical protein